MPTPIKPSPDWPMVTVAWWGTNALGEPATGTYVIEPKWTLALDDDDATPVNIAAAPIMGQIVKGAVEIDGRARQVGYFATALPASNIDAVFGSKAPYECTIKLTNGVSPPPFTFWADPSGGTILLPKIQPIVWNQTMSPQPVPSMSDINALKAQMASIANVIVGLSGGGGTGSFSDVFRLAMVEGR